MNFKTLIVILIVFGAWEYYTKNVKSVNISHFTYEDSRSELVETNLTNYQCDGREHCSQMGSYEEAKFFLDNCPNTKMDGDDDGIPCERQFGY